MELFNANLHKLIKIKMPFLMAASSVNILLTVLVIAMTFYLASKINKRPIKLEAPGPKPWPIIGSLHLMDGYKIPYAAFTAISKIYGDVFSITLGTAKCIVVNDPKSVKEVLNEKDGDFDSRPDFRRFDPLFGGDKQNSLAFCNYTTLQTKRRQILRPHTFPHAQSDNWSKIDDICQQELRFLIQEIDVKIRANGNNNNRGSAVVDVKTLILKACGNIFNEYFCSLARKEYDDEGFTKYIDSFDKVFFEVNNGRAVDFLPWLAPFMTSTLNQMKDWAQEVRHFVEGEIIQPKRETRAERESTADFLDGLMDYIDPTGEPEDNDEIVLNKQHALYALEDILGGHCAVGNIILRVFLDLAKNRGDEGAHDVQNSIKDQIEDLLGDEEIALKDKRNLHWLTAATNETIRMTCSPIVPHQATRNSTIAGYHVEKDTIVFVNNHQLNMADNLWSNPETYDPSRFLDQDETFKKPDHFQPFSMGRRSCMGYKIVQIVSYFIVANLVRNYVFEEAVGNPEHQLGMLSLPPGSYNMKLTRRQSLSGIGV